MNTSGDNSKGRKCGMSLLVVAFAMASTVNFASDENGVPNVSSMTPSSSAARVAGVSSLHTDTSCPGLQCSRSARIRFIGSK